MKRNEKSVNISELLIEANSIYEKIPEGYKHYPSLVHGVRHSYFNQLLGGYTKSIDKVYQVLHSTKQGAKNALHDIDKKIIVLKNAINNE